MKYNAIVKTFMGGQQLEIGRVEIEADRVNVGQSDSLEFWKYAGDPAHFDQLLLAVPHTMWLHVEEARMIQPAASGPILVPR